MLECRSCGSRYPVAAGIPDLRIFSDPYIDAVADREKGLQLAEHAKGLSFAELVDYYYRTTAVVPAQHARLYKKGLLAAERRSAQALHAWQSSAVLNRTSPIRFLDLGCGTGPLLVAAAKLFTQANRQLVGVDIAFRWLVVAQKRLAEAGLDLPLVCACAEALPFPDHSFDWVGAESVLETVSSQPETMHEVYRVTQPAGTFFVSTPNRFCPGPDPHVGIWGGALLPDRWLAALVRRQGGIPPRRRLLSAGMLQQLLRDAGFAWIRLLVPEIMAQQGAGYGRAIQGLIFGYNVIRRLPFGRDILLQIGPLLQAVALKSPASA